MTPMTNRVKVQMYFWGLAIETNIFVFEGMVILGFESTPPCGHVARIGINGPMTNRVKVQKLFLGLLI